MKKAPFILIATLMISMQSFAQTCVEQYMSEPTCINRVNAEQACKTYGQSPEKIKKFQEIYMGAYKRIVNFHGGNLTIKQYKEAKKSAAMRTFMMYKDSSSKNDNQTLCK